MASSPIVHIEIPAVDPAKASRFYAETFDWKILHDDSFDYYMFEARPGPGGGFVKVEEGAITGNPNQPLIYFGTDDIETTLAKIEANGGKTVAGKTEIPQTGWFAIFTDPEGNRLALYTAMHQH